MRREDPLPPYLFFLHADGLIRLLSQAKINGALNGVHVCQETRWVTNVLFVDDSIFLMHTNASNDNIFKNIIDQYCLPSTHLVSESKSSILLSPNTLVEVQEEVFIILNIMTEALADKYPLKEIGPSTTCFLW
jgi:hypothetical protein